MKCLKTVEENARNSLGGQFTIWTQLLKPNYLVIHTPSKQKLLSKSRLFTCPDDCNILMVAAGDESRSLVSFPQALVYSSFIMFLCSEWYLQCCTWSLDTSGVAKSDDKFNPFTFKISRITLFPHMYQQLLTTEGLYCLISEAW